MRAALIIATSLIVVSAPASAQSVRPSLADSFRLGTGGGVLCQVQSRVRDAATTGMFDRTWSIVCRDAARAVGQVRALRVSPGDAAQRLAAVRAQDVECGGQTMDVDVADLGKLPVLQCRLKGANVAYHVYQYHRGRITYVAEGLGGYDSALELALRTVVADRPVAGKVTVATTNVIDPVAFARVQAGTLDPEQALAEGYRRNNSGNYAEAAEFFDTLQSRVADDDAGGKSAEYLINRALQKSNLGDFGEADELFAQARKVASNDRVQSRLRRNFEAIHLLNQRRFDGALLRLNQPVAPIGAPTEFTSSAIEIGAQVAAEINSGIPVAQRLGASESSQLSADERARILDAQARQIRGTALRLKGDYAGARTELAGAEREAVAVRGGRVVSITRLRAQIASDEGLVDEATGDVSGGEAKLRTALALLETRYPETAAVNGAKARLAAYLARHGKREEALTMYAQVVQASATTRNSVTGLGNLLNPYLGLLIDDMAARPALAGDFFMATQALVRPGVADTQAILARELSEGAGEGSRLFRQARTLERDIERTRVELATLVALPQRDAATGAAIATLERDLKTFTDQQTATQAELGAFPQYRALDSSVLTLPALQTALKPGEAYVKMLIAGGNAYALGVTVNGARAWRIGMSPDQLDTAVDELRSTIVVEENGQLNTYPFDVAASRKLFVALFGPYADELATAKHIIFEPDGAMLRLPINLLVADDASVAAYKARTARPNADEFDFTGIKWLGRSASVSTAVSARSFRDARGAPASTAQKQYLGFGNNAPLTANVTRASTRGLSGVGAVDCNWPKAEWDKPISADELHQAAMIVGASQSAVVTGADFTDQAVMTRPDLANYRILHFATHGLVTAPRPECPARPALLTSFGAAGSDGLLSFREIYDLKIDADLVILSACDTAGKATIAATREAGVTTGGGNALDGLVRAFIGAGGRAVIASHWPAPDDFNATKRLITGLFEGKGDTVGDALRQAEVKLMDDPQTSHPYYWSGFAIVGDGSRTLLAGR
ncbi:UDP-2,3-diacylglucosamine diphosphatase LpxI [Sphingomonas antarctica]|uniref:CHAT domain-containing protein n=1 Tax=Sphingomonas antarctica TaxID=2040274 RepID=UPI0039E749B9